MGKLQPLRVMLVLESAGAGVGRHVIDLACGLIDRGHQVQIAYSPERAETPFLRELEAIPELKLHELHMHRAVGIQDLKSALALKQLLSEIGPFDVVHAHSSKAGALVRLALLGNPVPLVYTPHAYVTLDPNLNSIKRLCYATIERLLAPLASCTICVSEVEAEHAVSLGISEQSLRVIHNGLAPLSTVDRCSVRAEIGIPQDAVCIGTVGRLSHQKAIHRLVMALSMIQQENLNFRLVIVGDGPERAALEAQVAQLGLQRSVIFTGLADGPRLMAAFDVFALCSRYEAFPYVLLEAAARGLPILMTQTGGAGSVVEHERNGFVVPQGDLESLAGALKSLLLNPEMRSRMGRLSLAISRKFDIASMVEATEHVYVDIQKARQSQ